jgi:hypothetical protein
VHLLAPTAGCWQLTGGRYTVASIALIIYPVTPAVLPCPAASEALRVIKEAKALEAAGCFSVVLECVPGVVAAAVTRELGIPTIGIGAGPATSGQV